MRAPLPPDSGGGSCLTRLAPMIGSWGASCTHSEASNPGPVPPSLSAKHHDDSAAYSMNTRFCLLRQDTADGTTVQGITIDAPDSMDLDDAVWLEELDGRTRCTVSIADAAAAI